MVQDFRLTDTMKVQTDRQTDGETDRHFIDLKEKYAAQQRKHKAVRTHAKSTLNYRQGLISVSDIGC